MDTEPLACRVCGADLEPTTCWRCNGEDDDCDECGGDGEYLECPALPHTDAQLATHYARLKEKYGG